MKITMTTADLKEIYKVCKKVSKAGAKRQQWLEFIRLQCNENACVACVTDSYRVHSTVVSCEGDNGEMLIPVVSVPKSKIVEIENTGKEIIFTFDDTHKNVTRTPDVNFPNVERVIPENEPKYEITVSAKFLKEAAEALGSSDQVILEFRDGLSPLMMKGLSGGIAMVLPIRRPN